MSNQQSGIFLKKECTYQLSNTRRPIKPKKTSKMGYDRIISFVNKNNFTISNQSRTFLRRQYHCQSLQSKDSFMNENTKGLQNGANSGYYLRQKGQSRVWQKTCKRGGQCNFWRCPWVVDAFLPWLSLSSIWPFDLNI